MTGLEWLLERMRERADDAAIVWRDRSCSYAELLDRVAGAGRRLDGLGVAAGDVVALEGDYSPNACALLLALVERGAVTVPLTRAAAARREECLAVAEAGYAFTLDDADDWAVERRGVRPTHPLTLELIRRGDPGLVLFSSGSTGASKAVLHDMAMLLQKFAAPRHRLRTLTFLLLDHIGGINTLFYTLSNGGTVVTVSRRDPDAVCRAIERHRAQLLPTSPTFLNMLLLSGAHERYDLSSLATITYGTEVMPPSTLERVHRLFPGVRLVQTYGLSELGILRSKSRDSSSLWVKVGGESFETKVEGGTLWIRARSAMLGYLNAPSPFDAEGWMNTEDAVEVDGDYIRILGRRSDVINVGGEKVYPAEVEGVLLQMENVREATVSGAPHPLTGAVVAARVCLEKEEAPAALRRRIWSFCKDRLPPYKIPVKVTIATDDPVSPRFKKLRPPAAGRVPTSTSPAEPAAENRAGA